MGALGILGSQKTQEPWVPVTRRGKAWKKTDYRGANWNKRQRRGTIKVLISDLGSREYFYTV